jgi:hypothetical protein
MDYLSLLILFLVGLVAYGVWSRWVNSTEMEPEMKVDQFPLPQPEEPERLEDAFLSQISSAKAKADADVEVASAQHEKHLKEQFEEDLKLKRSLSEFATEHRLDRALVALWGEVKYLPENKNRPNYAELNKLNLVGVVGYKDQDTQTVELEYECVRFKIFEREWFGSEGEIYVDYSLFENGDLVFGVGCIKVYDEYVDHTRVIKIEAFKKRGTWAKMLLEYYVLIQIEQSKSSAALLYHGADKIKDKFQG